MALTHGHSGQRRAAGSTRAAAEHILQRGRRRAMCMYTCTHGQLCTARMAGVYHVLWYLVVWIWTTAPRPLSSSRRGLRHSPRSRSQAGLHAGEHAATLSLADRCAHNRHTPPCAARTERWHCAVARLAKPHHQASSRTREFIVVGCWPINFVK